ncbi:LuxR C-terminal-related transcriptional regulator [Cupriavidus pinatubonensis]|uniref:LuxR C-terminal-related transcriptional regulator n=1 Tax=Cupriavidus pinatubonensis TaxID=248026 RepID=UPI0015E3D375|nr:LuxR C-terminal-related transcriptional regulator [Cupriavidus pinatubonensis]
MTRDEWSRGRFAPPDFGFQYVPIQALSTLETRALARLTVVCAPPGYGKTVLLSRLFKQRHAQGERCLWLTLDDRNRDVLSLLALLRSALAREAKEHEHALPAAEADALAAPSEMMDVAQTLDAVVERISCLPGRTVLFIDNLGVCEDPLLPDLVKELLLHCSPNVHLVVSSTRAPPIDVSRLKLEVDVLELGERELSFDSNATRRLFQMAGFPVLAAQTLDEIQAHTEGWPAAVRLFQVLMSEERNLSAGTGGTNVPPTVTRRFNGDQREVARVLTERVLAHIGADRFQFLMEIALVHEFSAELAQFMTGYDEARSWLDDLVQRNVLIFHVDQERRWFRFHTLLRDYLLKEGKERIGPARRMEVLRKVAHWHVSRNDYVAALVSALDAPDVDLAQELIGRVAREVAADRGQMTLLVEWADRLMALGGKLPLQAQGWYVWALCHLMQYERARYALDAFDRLLSETKDQGARDSIADSDLAFLKLVLAVSLDTLDIAYLEALKWLKHDPGYDPLRTGTVAAVAAMADLDRGDLAEAQQHLDLAEGAIERSQSTFLRAWIGILRATLELSRARPDIADRLLRSAREAVTPQIGESASIVATIDFVRVKALVDLGELPQAHAPALHGLARGHHYGVTMTAELGLGGCVALLAEHGTTGLTDEVLDETARRYPPRVMAILSAQRMRHQLHVNHDVEEGGVLRRFLRPADPASSLLMRERGDWLLARIELMIAKGQLEQAREAIETELKLAQAQGRDSDRVSLLLAAMDALARLGRWRDAVRALARAIAIACPGNLIYPFLLYANVVANILEQVTMRDFGFVRACEINFLKHIRARLVRSDASLVRERDSFGELQPLTERETQLLRLINEGLSNQELADRLSVSLPTVKWHLKNLYSKLEVRNRSAALSKAREYGLITLT